MPEDKGFFIYRKFGFKTTDYDGPWALMIIEATMLSKSDAERKARLSKSLISMPRDRIEIEREDGVEYKEVTRSTEAYRKIFKEFKDIDGPTETFVVPYREQFDPFESDEIPEDAVPILDFNLIMALFGEIYPCASDVTGFSNFVNSRRKQ